MPLRMMKSAVAYSRGIDIAYRPADNSLLCSRELWLPSSSPQQQYCAGRVLIVTDSQTEDVHTNRTLLTLVMVR
jgi:hypothetical protein